VRRSWNRASPVSAALRASQACRNFALLRSGKRCDAVLDIDSHTALLYTGKVPVGTAFQYAYGFMDRVLGGRRWVGHGGSAAGMSGELAFEPNGGYVVVVLSNFDPPVAGQVLTILDRLPRGTQ
jgi:hypothetical protein